MKTRSFNSLQYTWWGHVLPVFYLCFTGSRCEGFLRPWPMKSSDNGFNSYVEIHSLSPLCVVLCLSRIDPACITALMTISSCSASLLGLCLRLVATWRRSREIDSVHWTPCKMKPDCRLFSFLILSFTFFQNTQGKFLWNSNTFNFISFFISNF